MDFFSLDLIEHNEYVPQILQEIEGLMLYEEYIQKGKDLYLHPSATWILIRDSNKHIIGYLCCLCDKFLPNSCNISIFEIKENCRGQGLGRKILDNIIATATSSSIFSSLTLQVRKPELIPFYTSLGFQKEKQKDIEFYHLPL